MRTVRVDARRLEHWLAGFGERHGSTESIVDEDRVEIVAEDGATALLRVPFPPLTGTAPTDTAPTDTAPTDTAPTDTPPTDTPPTDTPPTDLTLAGLLAHVTRERTVGALLIRRGGVAVGVFEGRRLVVSKIETAYVQGRTKAGGWSQQRYARRRGNQARKLGETAADLLASLVLPRADDLEALATGGDRSSVEAVLEDPRLHELRKLALDRIYPVADPRLVLLERFPEQFLAVEIELNDLA